MTINITSTKHVASTRLTCLVYGKPGVGKTSLAKTIDGRALIVSAESGLLSLDGTDIDVIEITAWVQLFEVFAFLSQPDTAQKYQWVFIDSLTELGQRLVESLKTRFPDKADALKMWGEYNDQMTAFIKAVRDLKSYSVVFTALATAEKDPLGITYHGVDLNGKISTRLPGYFDEVFAMRVFQDADGNHVRAMQTREQDGYIAKDRSGKLDIFEKPSMAAIAAKIINAN